jgi:ABC-type nickel/cobalt efflux system permease component RcnA
MIGLLSIIALGFFLGMRHATDPDHVIAVTTIVARYRRISHAAVIGAFWGVGHTLTILLVGSGIILFGWVIPKRIGLSMEFSVGLMLIFLGVLNLTGLLDWMNDTFLTSSGKSGLQDPHVHGPSDYDHVHFHQGVPEGHPHTVALARLGWFERHFVRLGLYQIVRPLVVGLVHGLAGSAAVALLVLATIQNPKWAIVYLLIFGIGTIAGMMFITGAMVLPFAYAGKRFLRLSEGLRVASGLISVAFGLFLVYEIGFVNGLFTNHPHWIPR